MSKVTRGDLQELARVRLGEARLLLDGKSFSGAYYLTGLAIECALKACIARSTDQYEFPDLKRAQDSWKHELNQLLATAGLTDQHARNSDIDKQFEANWHTVKDWKVDSRYEQRSERQAIDIYRAATEQAHGIIAWIERYW
jgi:HEPN domain-containing protein